MRSADGTDKQRLTAGASQRDGSGQAEVPPESDADLAVRIGRAVSVWQQDAKLADFKPVGAGSSGRTFRALIVGGNRKKLMAYVKVAPAGLEPVRNRDVMRQARVLQALADCADVPAPQVLFVDPGSPPAVPPYYIYPEVTGECWEPLTDESGWLPPPGDVRGRVLRAAEVLASLHAVDAAPFENIGIERIELADEVSRWLRAFERADNNEVYEVGAVCADALRARLPEAMPLTVVHGDFRLGNLVSNATSVLGVLDWEICSLADPRVDVAWFLMTLSAETLPSAIRATVPGLPTPSEVLERYESACGSSRRPLEDMAWFAALSGYRAAAAIALNVKHNRRSKAPSARIERYSQLLTRYLEVAQGLLG